MNVGGGIGGRPVQLVIEDTKSEPPTAVTAFTRISQRPEIVALFGSAASLDVPAYLPQVDAAGIPHLLPVAVLPSITEAGSVWTFRSALNDKIAAVKMAEFAVNQLGAKKIALLIEDSAFGATGLEFEKQIEMLGVKPTTIERLKRGDIDLRSQLTRIQRTGATHIQFWGYYSEFALAAKQLKELGYAATLMGNQAPVNDKTIELAGPAAEGVLNICLFVPTNESSEARQFTNAYRQKYRADPDTWAAQSYDAMNLLATVIREQGADRDKIRQGLRGIRDFRGITGTLSFMPNGDAAFRDTSIVTVKDGRFVPFTSGK
jgi:branched-chain amino acid transport system substrate-binding protein